MGSNVTQEQDLLCKKEIYARIAKALASLMALETSWKSKSISFQTKLSMLKAKYI